MKPPPTVVAAVLLALIASPSAQQAPTGPMAVKGVAPVRLPDEPMVIDTAEQHKIRVVVLAKGFLHPSSLAFIPDGGMLVTERAGRLRIVRGHVLDPEPIGGVPPVHVAQIWGLMDIALHPQFEATRLLISHVHQAAGRGAVHDRHGPRTVQRPCPGGGARHLRGNAAGPWRFADYVRLRRYAVHDGRRRSAGRPRAGPE